MRSFINTRRLVCHTVAALSLATIGLTCEPTVRAAQPAVTTNNNIVLVLGDSISAEYGIRRGAGWVNLLTTRLQERGAIDQSAKPWTVVNASISGETTAGGRTRIARLLKKHRPALLLLELGGNDALRGLDLNSSAKNLDQIAGLAKAQHAEVVVIGMRVPPNYGRAYTERFEQIFKDVAHAHDGELVPFLLSEIVGKEGSFQPDGFHPTGEVQSTLLNTAWPAIERAMDKTRK